jgi:beta-barrel assembly-enhancing protease
MMMKFLLPGLMVLLGGAVLAQNFDQYKTLVPAGPIPRDFTEKSFVKVAAEFKNMSASSTSSRRTKSRFYLESTFSIDDFLSSGSVLFNDQVSLYLRDVLNEVLKPYPHLIGKVRIYAVKSPVVNAFTTNNGIIFVNLGLLSRLENEAQLAFVLSHEVIHYEKQHILNAYITGLDIDRRNGNYKNISSEERGFAKSTYSKELESEADQAGSEIFLKSNYSKDSVEGIFTILKYADLPLSLKKFDKRIFESRRYVFQDSLMRFEKTSLDADEDYDDSKSSHPNVRKRKEAVLRKIGGKRGGKLFIISESAFHTVKKIARYEMIRMQLLEHQFLYALNGALDLQSTNPHSDFVRESVAKSLYGIAKQKSYDEFEVSLEEWNDESSKLASLIKNIDSYEAHVLALRHLYKCRENNLANKEIDLMIRDLVQSLIATGDLSPDRFDISKDWGNRQRYTQYAFEDAERPSGFIEIVKSELKNPRAERKQASGRYNEITMITEDIDKIVVVNPKYRKTDRRKRQRTRHIQAEKVVIDMNEKIHASAGKLNLLSEILNTNTLTPTEVRTMQSNTILNDWLQEQFRSGDQRMISPIYNEVAEVAAIHKTDHFLWLGCSSVIQKKKGKGYLIASAAIMPSILPWSAAYFFTPRGRTYYFALMFNVKTQELELSDLRSMSMKDSASLLESNIFYTLFRISNAKE